MLVKPRGSSRATNEYRENRIDELEEFRYDPFFDDRDLFDEEIEKEMRRGLENLSKEEIELREHLARCKALEDILNEQNIQ